MICPFHVGIVQTPIVALSGGEWRNIFGLLGRLRLPGGGNSRLAPGVALPPLIPYSKQQFESSEKVDTMRKGEEHPYIGQMRVIEPLIERL
jgi:hypothetical protein